MQEMEMKMEEIEENMKSLSSIVHASDLSDNAEMPSSFPLALGPHPFFFLRLGKQWRFKLSTYKSHQMICI